MNPFSGAVLAAMANSLWQVLAVLAAAWSGLRFTPRLNAATRHWIWWAVLAVIVTMPVAPWLMRAREPRHVDRPVASVSVPVAAVDSPMAFAGETPRYAPPVRRSGLAIRAGEWPARIFAIWLVVLLVQLGRIGWSYRYLRGIKRRAERATPEMRRDFDVWMLACGVRRPVQLLLSREVVSPMAVGFRTPAVIIPEALLGEFSESELDHVLLHELAHLARCDDWSNLAARVGWAFLVLHPAAAWVLRQIEREREIACDDWVVAATGEPRPYAASLARLFELCFTRRRALLATGMAERASLLGDRIEMLLRRSRSFTPRVSVASVAACAAALALFITVGSHAPRWIAFAQDDVAAPLAPVAPAAPVAEAAPAVADSPEPPQAAQAPQPAQAPQAAQAPQSRQSAQPAQAPQPTQAPQPAQAPPRGSFLAALVAAGYGNLSVDDIIALKNSGVTADFLLSVNRAGLTKLSPRELIDLRNNGVSPEYIREVRESGLSISSMRDVIDLRNNGVDANYIRAIETAGLGTYTRQQIVEFHQRGVNADLLRTLKDAGYHDVEPREIIELHDNGVGARNFREAKQYGPNLTLKQIIRLKQAGVI